jgi:hypothetical protein
MKSEGRNPRSESGPQGRIIVPGFGLRFVPVRMHPEWLQFLGGWMETIPFHCLHSSANRAGRLLGRGPGQPQRWSRPVQSVTPADGKGMEARESDLESPGLGFRVRNSDFLRISGLGFRIWFWLCQPRISGFGFPSGFGFRPSDFS